MSAPKPIDGALLLCLDLQPVFLNVVAYGPALVRRCAFAISAAKAIGVPIAFTEQVPEKLGATEPSLLALAGEAEVHPKDTFSALPAGSAIRAALTESRDIEHLILCGVETPICVFQTAIDAIQSRIEVTVLADCVGARRDADAKVCLESLARAGAHILPAETVFYTIVRSAQHPAFRSFTELVKHYA